MGVFQILAWHGGYIQTVNEDNVIECTCRLDVSSNERCKHIEKLIRNIKYSTQQHLNTSSKCEPGSFVGTRFAHSQGKEIKK